MTIKQKKILKSTVIMNIMVMLKKKIIKLFRQQIYVVPEFQWVQRYMLM